jgi:PD-(D/E)XK nuclease superfamily
MADPHLPIKRPPFPIVFDNTMRSTFVECPQKFWWEYGEHFKPNSISTDLHAGKAWASALETARMAYYRDGKSLEIAFGMGLHTLITEYGNFEPPPHKANKSIHRLVEAWTYYKTAFPFDQDPAQPWKDSSGKPMVEFSFALPLDPIGLRHPETGEPILYSGRADMIATYAGALSVYDDKTTSQLGPKWGHQWNRRSQFTGYVWAAQEYGIPVTQVLVRGIAILKTEINHAQAIVARPPHQIVEWHVQAIRDIKRAIECWKEGYWDLNLADTCSAYGGCMFQQPCMSKDPVPWLEGQFTRRVWNPLTREESETPK